MLNFITSKKTTSKTLIGILFIASLFTLAETNKAFASEESTPDTVTLTGTVRDFQASHPDFEFWLLGTVDKVEATLDKDGTTEAGKNIVTNQLGADKKPIYNSSNEAQTVESAATFNQWFNDVEGVNQSEALSLTLSKNADGMYEYSDDGAGFFPVNGKMFGNLKDDSTVYEPSNLSKIQNQTLYDEVDQWGNKKGSWLWSTLNNNKNKNYHFTYEIQSQFTYQGDEVFTFEGDDDVWVYIDGKRVIDLSGIHGKETDSVVLNATKAAELGLVKGKTYDLSFFFAERNFAGSNFKITTSIALDSEVFAD